MKGPLFLSLIHSHRRFYSTVALFPRFHDTVVYTGPMPQMSKRESRSEHFVNPNYLLILNENNNIVLEK